MLIPNKVTNGKKVTNHKIYVPDKMTGKKAIKQDNKDKLLVTVQGIEFEADTMSMCYMSNVLNVASMKYSKLRSSGSTPDVAYEASYKTSIGWKCTDNVTRQVTIEILGEALELAMGQVANIIEVGV